MANLRSLYCVKFAAAAAAMYHREKGTNKAVSF